MSARAVHLVIDARPRGPRGLLAAEVVLGKNVLEHLLDLAEEHVPRGEAIIVHARDDEHARLRDLALSERPDRVVFVNGPTRADAAVLRTDRLYDRGRLRRGLRRGRSPESAVLWRLDQPEALSSAEDELTRRVSYQPLGKYWAFPIARRLAELLCPTSIRPNALTLASGGLMLAAALVVAFGPGNGWIERIVVALGLALALILDTADGRLARLQGTRSALGQWLDQVLDELADMALHAAIAWSAFSRDGQPVWLLLGMLYASGKYLFVVQSLLGEELERTNRETSGRSGRHAAEPGRSRDRDVIVWLKSLVRMVGHADVRWHGWIVLSLLGRLDVALAVYAAYFPLRAFAGAVRKGVRYA